LVQCTETLRLRCRPPLHKAGHLAGDAELLVEWVRCGNRPAALPRPLSRIDCTEMCARDIDVNMDTRVIEAGNGVDSPVRGAGAELRTRGRPCPAAFRSAREVLINAQ